ncbi:MAG: hypothetical protein WD294_00050 [Phycisphaeraceae bacterium]
MNPEHQHHDNIRNSRLTRALTLALLGSLSVTFFGCQTNGGEGADEGYGNTPPPTIETGLAPKQQPPIRDLPVPVWFEIIDEQSRSYEANGVRFVDHTYQGRATKTQLERFYREQLPVRGWRLRNAQMVRGTHILRYQKNGEGLDVQIADDDRPFRGAYSRVTLLIQSLDGPE